MKPQVYHVDAFTSQPFRGNSAGVVFPADNLSEAQMQLIARELGHSETAFLLHSDDSDVRIRYFTPTVEVPICGHATVAAHYVRAKVLGLGNCTIWQTSLAGKHRVTIEKHNDDYRISLEQGTPGFEPPLEGETRAAIINALHLTEDDILPGLPIQVATTGHSKVMIPLKPEVDIDALSPDLNALTAPIRLVSDLVQTTPHGEYRLLQEGDDWVLQFNHHQHWQSMYRFDLCEQQQSDYVMGNFWSAHWPQSHFRHHLLMCRHLPDGGKLTLTNFHFTHYENGHAVEQRNLPDVASLYAVMQEQFGLGVDDAKHGFTVDELALVMAAFDTHPEAGK
jgi:hypothetical protein